MLGFEINAPYERRSFKSIIHCWSQAPAAVKNEVSGNDLRDTRQVQQRESMEIQCKWIQLEAVVADGLPSDTSGLKCATKPTIPTFAPDDISVITSQLGLCWLGDVRPRRRGHLATESKAECWAGEDARASAGGTTSTGRSKSSLGMTRLHKENERRWRWDEKYCAGKCASVRGWWMMHTKSMLQNVLQPVN